MFSRFRHFGFLLRALILRVFSVTTVVALEDSEPIFDVIVVGNGPSALALGAVLNRPWVVADRPPPRSAAAALTDAARDLRGKSLLTAPLDLDAAGRRLAARCVNPTAALVDALRFPIGDGGGAQHGLLFPRETMTTNASCGDDDNNHHSDYAGASNADGNLSHLAIGRGRAGGSWHAMPSDFRTLSPAAWMSLPGLPYDEFAATTGRAADGRVARADVAAYFEDYAARYVAPGALVDGEVMTVAPCTGAGCWRVEYNTAAVAADGEADDRVATRRPRVARARALVLATGAYDAPLWLGVPGEDLPAVTHRPITAEVAAASVGAAAAASASALSSSSASPSSPPLLVVVGAGLSAADAVLAWRRAGGAVLHVFRGDASATKIGRMFGGGGGGGMYADEADLAARMMASPAPHASSGSSSSEAGGYEPLAGGALAAVRARADSTGVDCELVDGAGTRRLVLGVSQVAVLIGAAASLEFLPPGVRSALPSAPVTDGLVKLDGTPSTHALHVHVDPRTCEALDAPEGAPLGARAGARAPLYAVGPLRGDNFVRFVVGDAVSVARDLGRRKAEGWPSSCAAMAAAGSGGS